MPTLHGRQGEWWLLCSIVCVARVTSTIRKPQAKKWMFNRNFAEGGGLKTLAKLSIIVFLFIPSGEPSISQLRKTCTPGQVVVDFNWNSIMTVLPHDVGSLGGNLAHPGISTHLQEALNTLSLPNTGHCPANLKNVPKKHTETYWKGIFENTRKSFVQKINMYKEWKNH